VHWRPQFAQAHPWEGNGRKGQYRRLGDAGTLPVGRARHLPERRAYLVSGQKRAKPVIWGSIRGDTASQADTHCLGVCWDSILRDHPYLSNRQLTGKATFFKLFIINFLISTHATIQEEGKKELARTLPSPKPHCSGIFSDFRAEPRAEPKKPTRLNSSSISVIALTIASPVSVRPNGCQSRVLPFRRTIGTIGLSRATSSGYEGRKEFVFDPRTLRHVPKANPGRVTA
jgi:hypothetical protein